MNPELLKRLDPIARNIVIPDLWTRFKNLLRRFPLLGSIFGAFIGYELEEPSDLDGFYLSYTLDESEFVGQVPYAIPGIHHYLPKNGYEDPPTAAGISLQAAKLHPETGEPHDWSYRKVDAENPRYQYHIHGWKHYEDNPMDAYDEIATHYEFRPDLKPVDGESLSEMYERLRTHYRPEWGSDEYVQGKADDTVRELVE